MSGRTNGPAYKLLPLPAKLLCAQKPISEPLSAGQCTLELCKVWVQSWQVGSLKLPSLTVVKLHKLPEALHLSCPWCLVIWTCRELMSAMASQTMQRLQHFNSQNISNTLWAMASLNYHPGSMLLKVGPCSGRAVSCIAVPSNRRAELLDMQGEMLAQLSAERALLCFRSCRGSCWQS